RLALGVLLLEQLHDAVGAGDTGVQDLGLLEERDGVVAVLGPERGAPALVLLQPDVEALRARLGALALLAVEGAHVQPLALVVQMGVLSARISGLEVTLSIRVSSAFMVVPLTGRPACVLRPRPCLAEPPAESPSTTNRSASAGSRTEQSAS